ncbi:retinol dehydrogenase 12-like [Oppia nitens]|uniref:retinol dehydrogenase 12-like n=1 Tax=Oppia nitens TaxID=1686743 RepID=UPI0023DAB565|nr:retinol dehydrogenase 12-like [Oppia nitens]
MWFMCHNVKEFTGNVTGGRKRCLTDRRLDGQVVVVTGANTGIGKETANQLALRGAKLYIGCRDLAKAEIAVKEMRDQNPKSDVTALKLDLSSLKSVREFAADLANREKRLDILVNNAGVFACPEWKTEDGFEMQFGTNHLGSFLLTLSLTPLLKQSPSARIVNVSSAAHMIGHIDFDNINQRNGIYTPMKAYAHSKLANVLFTRELAKRLGPNSTVRVYALNPGTVKTDAQRHVTSAAFEWFMKRAFLTPEMGAQTSLYCSLDPTLDNETGFYYDNCKRVNRLISEATDDKVSERLWELSCQLVNLEDHLRRLFIKTPTSAWN